MLWKICWDNCICNEWENFQNKKRKRTKKRKKPKRSKKYSSQSKFRGTWSKLYWRLPKFFQKDLIWCCRAKTSMMTFLKPTMATNQRPWIQRKRIRSTSVNSAHCNSPQHKDMQGMQNYIKRKLGEKKKFMLL